MTINQQAFDPFLDYTATGKHDACFLGWMTDNADPDNFYYALLHPGVSIDEVPDGQDWVSFDTENFNTLNVAGWANTDFMKLVEDAQATYDNAARKKKYKQAGENRPRRSAVGVHGPREGPPRRRQQRQRIQTRTHQRSVPASR